MQLLITLFGSLQLSNAPYEELLKCKINFIFTAVQHILGLNIK